MAAVRIPRLPAAILLVVAVLAASVATAADRFGPISPPGAQFMVYVSRSLGGAGHATRVFGLRFENTTSAAIDASTRFAAPLRHRSLLDLQFSRFNAVRLQLGTRATWDMGRRQLGPTADLVDSPWQPGALPAVGKPETQLP
jgi:hypothetical protein